MPQITWHYIATKLMQWFWITSLTNLFFTLATFLKRNKLSSEVLIIPDTIYINLKLWKKKWNSLNLLGCDFHSSGSSRNSRKWNFVFVFFKFDWCFLGGCFLCFAKTRLAYKIWDMIYYYMALLYELINKFTTGYSEEKGPRTPVVLNMAIQFWKKMAYAIVKWNFTCATSLICN